MRKPFTYQQAASVVSVRGGCLYWTKPRKGIQTGARAGGLKHDGYVYVKILDVRMPAHHVVWLLTYRQWPNQPLDHINGVRSDNRPENLREATPTDNSANRRCVGVVPFKGVVLHKQTGRFQATCARKYLGLFATPEEAARVYDAAASAKYGNFARLNFGSAA